MNDFVRLSSWSPIGRHKYRVRKDGADPGSTSQKWWVFNPAGWPTAAFETWQGAMDCAVFCADVYSGEAM